MPAGPPRTRLRRPARPFRLSKTPIDAAVFRSDRTRDRDALVAGVIGTVILHLLFLLLLPKFLIEHPIDPAADAAAATPDLDLNLVTEADEAAQGRYVETNPDAPENTPDNTTNFSARNQQAANVEAPKELSPDRTPAREGEAETPYDKTFAGEIAPPVEVMPAPPPPEPQEANPEKQASQRQDPLPGYEKDEPKSDDGTGMSVAEASPNASDVPEKIEGEEEGDTEAAEGGRSSLSSPDRPMPAPRPRVQRGTPGIVRRQAAGVSQTGYIGVNANFSEFGEYMERMVEAVTQRWHGLCASRSYGETQTHVMLEFKVTREGTIEEMSVEESTSQALGVLLCRTAIEQGAPYGVWPKEMVGVLGEQQTVRFAFYYR